MRMHHTPGPWHLVETEPGIAAEMDVFVTTPRWAGGTALIARVINADDAQLISAAPELLIALQALMNASLPGMPIDPVWIASAHKQARAAIVKATGEGESK